MREEAKAQGHANRTWMMTESEQIRDPGVCVLRVTVTDRPSARMRLFRGRSAIFTRTASWSPRNEYTVRRG